MDIEKSFRLGGALLVLFGGGACLIAAILSTFYFDPIPSFGKTRGINEEIKSLTIPFDLQETVISFPVPNIENEFSVSFDPVHPDAMLSQDAIVTVKLKKSGQIRRVLLPSRIDLFHEKGVCFSEKKSPFWIELRQAPNRQVEMQMFIETEEGSVRELKRFWVKTEESPIRSSSDFLEGSPYRLLAEARLLGRDLFIEKYGDGNCSQRLEIGPVANAEMVSILEGDYLAWKEGKWLKIDLPSEGKGALLAKVSSLTDRSVLLEVWGLDEYMRLSVSSPSQSPLKGKGDEFLASVRVRSEKQMSCTLDKQCFVLRANDWVLKEENRWKVLRKSEEKEAFIQGKLVGEMFVFDRIDAKNGQKTVHGHLFNPSRSQVSLIEVPVQSSKKQGKDLKGKSK